MTARGSSFEHLFSREGGVALSCSSFLTTDVKISSDKVLCSTLGAVTYPINEQAGCGGNMLQTGNGMDMINKVE
jgi:hypothetical protein